MREKDIKVLIKLKTNKHKDAKKKKKTKKLSEKKSQKKLLTCTIMNPGS